MPARRSGGTFDVLGRILPASRQGAPLIEIGRTGALVRKLQPAQ
jgi:hypothetical protein